MSFSAITYLSPSVPEELFRRIVEAWSRRLGRAIELESDPRISGPLAMEDDRFGRDEMDVGFLCCPSYVWLRERTPSSVELLGAPVFDDPRNRGKPVYFAEIIVPRDSPHESFDELEGRRWVYNDPCSLSGYFGVIAATAERQRGPDFFGEVTASGSHLESLDRVARGEADVASIDSTVLALRFRQAPELRDQVRVIDRWGPFPIQPVVVRKTVPAADRRALRESLLELQRDPEVARSFRDFGLTGFVAVSDEFYDREERILRGCRGWPGPTGS